MGSNTIEIVIRGKDEASGVLGGVQKALGGLGTIAGGVLKAGALAGAAGLGALTAGLGLSIKEALGAQEVQAQLSAVLESTGGAAGVTAEMANDLATNLSGVTRFSDDAVLAGENMLLTFTNIGKDVFPDATQAILDLSTATGQDLQSSAVQLGKALNDPIAGITALQRVGVTFTDEQKTMIEGMVEAGDVMGAQKLILAELSKEFGGSATAAGSTFAGQLDILKNSLLNVAEGIGMSLLPIGQMLLEKFILPALPAIQKFGEALGRALEKLTAGDLKGALAEIFPPDMVGKILAIAAAVGGFVETVSKVAGALRAGDLRGALVGIFGPEVAATISGAIATISNIVQTFIGNVQAWFAAHGPQIKGFIDAAWNGIKAVIQSVLAVVRPAVETAMAGIQKALGSIQPAIDAFKKLWESLGPFLTTIGAVIGGIVLGIIGIVVGLFSGIASAIGPFIQTISDVIAGIVTIVSGVMDTVTGLLQMIYAAVTGNNELLLQAWETFKGGVAAIWQGLVDTVTGLVSGLWETLTALVSGLVEGIIGFFTNLYNTLVGGSIVPDLVNGIVTLFQFLSDTASRIWEAIKGAIETIAGAIKTVIDGFISGVTTAWNLFVGVLQTVWETAWTAVKTAFETAAGLIKGVIETFIGAVKGVWDTFLNKAGGLLLLWQTAWDAVKKKIDDIWGLIKGVIDTLISGILGVWRPFLEGSGSIKALWGAAWDAINTKVGQVASSIKGIVDGIIAKVSAALGAIASLGSAQVRTGGGSGTTTTTGSTTRPPSGGGGGGTTTGGGRSQMAWGGPILEGLNYLAGENVFTRPEFFVASENGYMLTRREAQEALRGRAGAGVIQNISNTWNIITNAPAEAMVRESGLMKAWET